MGRCVQETCPPLRRLHRAMGVLAIGQGFDGREGSNVGEHEPPREAEEFVNDPGQVVLGAVLEHVGANHPVDCSLGRRDSGW